MTPQELQAFKQLTAQALAGSLDRQRMLLLREQCLRDPERQAIFSSQANLDRLLGQALRDPTGETFAREVVLRIAKERDAESGSAFVGYLMERLSHLSNRRKMVKITAVVASVVAVLLGFGWLWASAPVGRISRGDAAHWVNEAPQATLRAGSRLLLASGLAEIHFRKGAKLILEGPADLEIRGREWAWLHRGRASVEISDKARGFVLETIRGRVMDLGTAFGMFVNPLGDVEVQVFEGRVKALPVAGNQEIILSKNETLLMQEGGHRKRARVSANAFVTSMPPQAVGPSEFIHWAFDEGRGSKIAWKGALAGQNLPPAQVRWFSGRSGSPEWIPGVFGSALAFNGEDQAVETFYEGLGGNTARTIAFWLRVPEDFDPRQGYGVLSWGELSSPGSALQISANPISGEGALGTLRVGLFKSSVVGSTDLRDGRWHHCAVVLYGDQRKRNRMPILLYVDGKMESTAIKAMSGIDTSVGEGAKPVWIGRNLRHGMPGNSHHQGTGFFRGALDEVYIFNSALNREQILTLIRENRPPGQEQSHAKGKNGRLNDQEGRAQ